MISKDLYKNTSVTINQSEISVPLIRQEVASETNVGKEKNESDDVKIWDPKSM